MSTIDFTKQENIEPFLHSLANPVEAKTGNTSLMQMICSSVSTPDLICAIESLSVKELSLTKRNLDGFNAIHLAILKADVEMSRALLKKSHNLMTELDKGKQNYSLLQCAVLSQNRFLIQEVSQYSNDLAHRSDDGMNALEVSLTGSLLVINFMAQKYNVLDLEKAVAYLENQEAPFYSKHNQQAKGLLENLIEQKRCQK